MRFAAVAAIVCCVTTAHAAVEDDLRDGDKYFEDGDWKRAAAGYDRAIAKAPTQVPAQAYAKRAAIFIILKDYKGALDFVGKAKARHPSSTEILEQEALILWETERRDEAVAVAEKVVVARPTAFTNQKLIGEYYAQRDPERTASAFELYLTHRPPELQSADVMPRIRLGFAYLASARVVLGEGDDERAQQLYTKAAAQFEVLLQRLAKRPNAVVNAENGLCAAYTGLGRWDQAIQICERVSRDPTRIDAAGSVWFNLSKAYLARKQTKKARSAATEFARLRKHEARGHMLLGDTYFADRDWQGALDHYLRAEKALRPTQAREEVELSIQLGKTYRRLPSSGATNLGLAIDKLAAAHAANPTNVELAVELGGAYLEARLDAKTTALTDTLLAGATLAKAPPATRASVLVLSGKALFNQRKLTDARQRFESARELRPSDIQIKRQLVATINEQAFAAGKDHNSATSLLDEALAIDPASPATLTNLAVLSIDRGDCQAAQRQLTRIAGVRGSDAVVTARLLARSHLCLARPDRKKASDAYAIAEREAKNANAVGVLAEIYGEWAPLLWDTDLAGAIDKLELAATSADVGHAVKRNLALALYRRGWKLVRDGKTADAARDFERGLREPSALRGTEPQVFELSLALAQLESGHAADAAKRLRGLVAKGNGRAYLLGAYGKYGLQLLAAYATARSQPGAVRQQACAEMVRLEAEVGGRARELVASCWETVAQDHWRAGHGRAATKALMTADRYASLDQKKRLDIDRAAATLGTNTRDKLGTLEALGGSSPEALVNLGIVYDLLDRPMDAYDAWTRAKARGATTRDLQKWLDAKRRIHGY